MQRSSIWIVQRIFAGLFTALAAFVLVFSFLRMIPGDPIELMLGEQAQVVQKEALRKALGLDLPYHRQLIRDVSGLFQADLGQSLTYRKPVTELIGERLGATAILALCSLLVAILIALPLGVLSGWRPRSLTDRFSRVLAVVGVSMPNFWLGPLLLLAFAVYLPIFPLGGYFSYHSLVLPSFTLGTALAAILTRMWRSSVSEARKAPFVTTARAKGLSERTILRKHVLKLSSIPVLTLVGLQLGALLSGAVITETIFQWPGIGRLLIQAVQARDYPTVQGLIVVFTGSYVLINTLVDIGYGLLDPRARLEA